MWCLDLSLPAYTHAICCSVEDAAYCVLRAFQHGSARLDILMIWLYWKVYKRCRALYVYKNFFFFFNKINIFSLDSKSQFWPDSCSTAYLCNVERHWPGSLRTLRLSSAKAYRSAWRKRRSSITISADGLSCCRDQFRHTHTHKHPHQCAAVYAADVITVEMSLTWASRTSSCLYLLTMSLVRFSRKQDTLSNSWSTVGRQSLSQALRQQNICNIILHLAWRPDRNVDLWI